MRDYELRYFHLRIEKLKSASKSYKPKPFHLLSSFLHRPFTLSFMFTGLMAGLVLTQRPSAFCTFHATSLRNFLHTRQTHRSRDLRGTFDKRGLIYNYISRLDVLSCDQISSQFLIFFNLPANTSELWRPLSYIV